MTQRDIKSYSDALQLKSGNLLRFNSSFVIALQPAHYMIGLDPQSMEDNLAYCLYTVHPGSYLIFWRHVITVFISILGDGIQSFPSLIYCITDKQVSFAGTASHFPTDGVCADCGSNWCGTKRIRCELDWHGQLKALESASPHEPVLTRSILSLHISIYSDLIQPRCCLLVQTRICRIYVYLERRDIYVYGVRSILTHGIEKQQSDGSYLGDLHCHRHIWADIGFLWKDWEVLTSSAWTKDKKWPRASRRARHMLGTGLLTWDIQCKRIVNQAEWV